MRVTVSLIQDEEQCHALWNHYADPEKFWERWDVRYAFHIPSWVFHFMLFKENKKDIGLLPLVYHKKEKYYTFFGDTYPERNRFFASDNAGTIVMLNMCPRETYLYNIETDDMALSANLSVSERRFFLPLDKYQSFEQYLAIFSKKHRKNFLNDLKKVQNIGIEIKKNVIKDFSILSSFNRQRFGSESDFSQPEFVMCMQAMLTLASTKGWLDLISIYVGGKPEAVGFGIIYNKVYYVFNTGRNPAIANIGKYLIAEHINSAIAKKCVDIDFLASETHWKVLWNLDSKELYEFVRN